jgi:hypothetical protein
MSPDVAAELIEALEGEVNNGGFDQFFYNNAGDNTADTILALEAIGAVRTADIVKRAAAMFPGGMPPKERVARQNVLLATLHSCRAFEALDREFYEYLDDLAGLVKTFKDSH